jgi:hypothetical protein
MRVAKTVVLTEEEQTMLTKLSRGQSTQARVVLRAKMCWRLRMADGTTALRKNLVVRGGSWLLGAIDS